MLSLRLTLTTAALALIVNAASAQTTYYVDIVNGDNNNAGTSPTAAFANIWRAQAFANRGDTIQVAPGVYSPSSNETFPLGPFGDVTVLGADPRTTIIDSETPAWPASANYTGDLVHIDSNTTFSGFTIRNGPHGSHNWWSGAIHIYDFNGGLQVSNVTVENCILDRINRAFYVGMWSGCIIDNVTIRNNFITRSSSDAIGFFADVNSTLSVGNKIHNNTILGNDPAHTVRTALWFEKGVTVDIRNNNLTDFTWWAVGIAGLGTNVFELHHNNCLGGPGTWWTDPGDPNATPPRAPTIATVNETNTISVNPMVVDLPGDPHLMYGSPCIDAGDPLMTSTNDIDGNDVSGSAIDIGCDERRLDFLEADLYLWEAVEGGQNTTFTYLGQPGDFAVVYTSAYLSLSGPINLGAMGTLYLDPLGMYYFGPALTLDSNGLAQAIVPVPPTPYFFGVSLYYQSVNFPPTLTAVGLSDLETIVYGM